jgi:hypothetical protein
VIPNIDEIPAALRGFLCDLLGELPFHVHGGGPFGGIGKYLHLHASVVAPPAGTVPMAIEVYGRVVALGDVDLSSLAGGRLLIHRERERRRHADIEGRELPVPIFVRMDVATYANVLYPGVGVPSYL